MGAPWQRLAPHDARLVPLGSSQPRDAHAAWAFISDFRGFTVQGARDPLLPVLVELSKDCTAAQAGALARLIAPPDPYLEKGQGQTGYRHRFWTGTVLRSQVPLLAAMPGVAGWRMGLPNLAATQRSESAQRLPLSDARAQLAQRFIGVIDHSLAVGHEAFRDDQGRLRLHALWDQDPGGGPAQVGNWCVPKDFGHGRELLAAGVDAAFQKAHGHEARAYDLLGYGVASRAVGHGTHVMSLAAGRLAPPPRFNPAEVAIDDPAARAPLVAVQLPWRPAKDTSGTSLCVSVLDALHYIAWQGDGRHDIVVNLSDGAYGGPHDGRSMLERAIDEFLGLHPHVHLVLAAGNAARDEGHAKGRCSAASPSTTFHWQLLPDDVTDSFMEIWFDRTLPAGAAQVEITLPDGSRSGPLVIDGSPWELTTHGEVVAALIPALTSPNGRHTMLLLAVAPTQRRQGAAAPHGRWEVQVELLQGDDTVQVDAWIERDNPALGDRGPRRQSRLASTSTSRVDPTRTLGSLAGAQKPLLVSGRYARGRVPDGARAAKGRTTDVAVYASRGRGRWGPVNGPDLLAPSDESPVLHGLLGAAQRSGAYFRMDGTSAAAPVVARQLFNQLSQSRSWPKPTSDEQVKRLVQRHKGRLRRP